MLCKIHTFLDKINPDVNYKFDLKLEKEKKDHYQN